jgi:hypothetical protein
MKNKSVCKGCKYYIVDCYPPIFKNSCDYLHQTGKSRIVVEMENGGVKANSCVCYEAGRYKRHGKQSLNIKKVR